MSDIGDTFKALRQEDKRDRADNRDAAAKTLSEASKLAAENGMILVRNTEAHYQVKHKRDGWILDVYPGNQRLYAPVRPGHPRAPYITMPYDRCWTLTDVVAALVAVTAGGARA